MGGLRGSRKQHVEDERQRRQKGEGALLGP